MVAKFPEIPYTFAERGTNKEEYLEWKKGKEEQVESEPISKKEEPKKVEEAKVEPVVESIPEPKLVEFTPATTKAEAEEFAMQFAENVDYSKLSLDKANAINEEFHILSQKYPINKLDEICPTRTGRAIMEANARTFRYNKANMGVILEKEHNNFLKMQKDDQEFVDFLIKRYSGKGAIPNDIQSRIDILTRNLQYTRWTVSENYENKIGVSVAHEYGHIIADQYFGQINGEKANPNYNNYDVKIMSYKWDKIYTKAVDDGDIYSVSKYGATDSHEFFAECFAAREFGEELPDYINDFMQEVLDNGIM